MSSITEFGEPTPLLDKRRKAGMANLDFGYPQNISEVLIIGSRIWCAFAAGGLKERGGGSPNWSPFPIDLLRR